MKRLFLLLCFLLLAGTAKATTIAVQSQQFTGIHFNGISASNPPHIHVVANQSFTTSDGKRIQAGSVQGTPSQIYLDIACTMSGSTVTCPTFNIDSTRDSPDNPSATYSFYWYKVTGTTQSYIAPVEGATNLQVPQNIASASACSPAGTCCTITDLIIYNQGSPPLPISDFYTKSQVDAKISTIIQTGAFAPTGSTYLLETPNVAQLPNSFALSSLATGILKNTTGTGVPSIAAGGTDYEFPLTFNGVLSRSVNTITCPTCEVTTNKNAAGGYAGLIAGKVANSQISEVLNITDIVDYLTTSGTGSTALKATITSPSLNQALIWNGSNWVNGTPGVAGTVTTFSAGNLSPLFTTSVANPTSTPALSFTLSTQTANTVFSGPTSGGAATPTFRSLVVADLPTVDVPHGGSGVTSFTAYGILAAGTTATGNLQQVSGTGTSGQVLTSNGPGTLPTWQAGTTGTHNLLSATHPDTTTGTVARGDLITGQGTVTAAWAKKALGAQYKTVQSDGSDVVYDAVHLDQSAAVTGALSAVNGGLGIDTSAVNEGALPIKSGAGWAVAQLTAGSNITITPTAGGISIAASGVLGTKLNNITDPDGNLALAMGTNRVTATTSGNTSTNDIWTILDSTGNTGTGHLLFVHTTGTSAAKPFAATAKGTANGIEMDNTGSLSAVGTGAIVATSGDSATAFFPAGQIEAARGGTGIDTSGSTGVLRVNGGTWTANAGISHLASSTSADLRGVLSDETGTGAAVFANTPTLVTPVLGAATGTSLALGGGTALTTTNQTGTGNLVLATSPTIASATLGTPTVSVAARGSGTAAYFTLNIPADTGITQSTESIGFKTVTATRTWDTAAPATNREFLFVAPTYDSSAGPTTMTTGATVAISGAPSGTANLSITRPVALWLQAGRLSADDAGVVFDASYSNLTDPVSVGGDLPQRFGLATGSSGSAVTSRFPSIAFATYTKPASGGGGTTTPYLFYTDRQDGGAQGAVYNILGYVKSEDTNASNKDIVAVAGIAVATSGSTSRAYGGYFVGNLNNQNTGQGAVGVEADVQNDSGTDAPALTASLPAGYTIGIDIAPKGSKLSSAAINLQGTGATAWKTGIHFPGDVIATGGYGIDFKYATRGAPIRLPNLGALSTGYIYGRNAADSADKKLLGITSGNLVSIDGDALGTSFGGGIRPGTGSFVSSTAQLYTTATQGLVITAGAGSTYDFLLAARDGSTLAAVISSAKDLQIGAAGGFVYEGGGALATNATTGFSTISSTAGTPTGAPTPTAGYIPIVVDTTNGKLCARYGGAWHCVTLP